jgi:hypothetical protein
MKQTEYILEKANAEIKKALEEEDEIEVDEHCHLHKESKQEQLIKEPTKIQDPSKQIVKLDLQNDIYSYTYFKIWSDTNHYRHAELMIKCFLAIIIQVSLIYLRFTEAINSPMPLVPGTPELNIIRLTSAFFMHVQLYPEIQVSLEMIKYSVFNQEKFKGGAFLPMLLALSKAFGSIMAEFGSSYLIVRATNVATCLVAFLGMSLVANIDDIMAKTVTGANIGEEISA